MKSPIRRFKKQISIKIMHEFSVWRVYFIYFVRLLSVLSLSFLLYNSFNYDTFWNLPTTWLDLSGIFEIPYVTQVFISLPLIFLLGSYFISIDPLKNPGLWFFIGIVSCGGLLTSFRLLRFFANDQETEIPFKLVKFIRKFTSQEKLTAFKQTFYRTLEDIVKLNPQLETYKTKILFQVENAWPQLSSFELKSLSHVKEQASKLPLIVYNIILQEEQKVQKQVETINVVNSQSFGNYLYDYKGVIFVTCILTVIGILIWYNFPTKDLTKKLGSYQAEGAKESATLADTTAAVAGATAQLGKEALETNTALNVVGLEFDNVQKQLNLNNGLQESILKNVVAVQNAIGELKDRNQFLTDHVSSLHSELAVNKNVIEHLGTLLKQNQNYAEDTRYYLRFFISVVFPDVILESESLEKPTEFLTFMVKHCESKAGGNAFISAMLPNSIIEAVKKAAVAISGSSFSGLGQILGKE